MTRDPRVDAWFASYDNPQKALVQATREACLAADPRTRACIKWQAPTFTHKGNIAGFVPKARAHVGLMFHTGATIPGTFPSLEDDGAKARSFKIKDAADLGAKTTELQAILSAWCDMRDGS